jgi:hypothetical protein
MLTSARRLVHTLVSAAGVHGALDLRSLALFRIGLGVTLLLDLQQRYPNLAAHYSDAGALPRRLAGARPWVFSLYFASGEPWLPALLFLVTAAAAALLVMGWRARWMAAVCWFLLGCLHERNEVVLHSGDNLLRLLLFWGAFLPLGARWSVDSRREPGQAPDASWSGAAGLALQLQLVVVYVDTGLRKLAQPAWQRGLGVYNALSLDHVVSGLGELLEPHFPLLVALSYLTLVLEIFCPFLLFVRDERQRVRALAVVGFALFHAGLGLTLRLGTFSVVCIVAWAAMAPGPLWRGRAGSAPAGPDVVTAPPPFRRSDGVALLASAYLLVAGLVVALGAGRDALFLRPARALGLHLRWNMFVTHGGVTGTIITEGTTTGGERRALLVAGAPRTEAEARFAPAVVADMRWRKLMERFIYGEHARYVPPHLTFVCGAWNAGAPAASRLARAALIYEWQVISGPYLRGPPQRMSLGERTCE